MILETLWGLLLASLCFWVASQGSTFRGFLAAVFAFILVTACTLVIALYFSSLSVVRKAVSDAALGRSIFDALFDYALGVSRARTLENDHLPQKFRRICPASRWKALSMMRRN